MQLISNHATAELFDFPENEFAHLRAALDSAETALVRAENAANRASQAQFYWGFGGFLIGALVMSISHLFY